ncbi:MAG: hypothetical protein HY784_02735 [Chloroflexi bacterium]|nr:hypothetical protein [Chloroflexota bacterium]
MTRKHALIMLACCLIPLAALAAIFVFRVPANSVLFFGILLLCPALHLLLMRNAPAGHAAGHGAPLSPPPADRVAGPAGSQEPAIAGKERP